MSTSSSEFYQKAPPDRGASSFIYPPTAANIRFFADALRSGCVVALPTETVYGLAALALEEAACRSIFSIKSRPLMDPLIVHVTDLSMAEELAVVPDNARKLAKAFWPGPLTLVLKKRPIVPDLITAGMDTVAIRIPRHPVAADLLRELQAPLAAPSANPFGYVSPTRPEHVTSAFGAKVPFVLDGGPSEVGLESSILDMSGDASLSILRPGAIAAQEISAVLQRPVETRTLRLKETEAATAPGTMLRHYSPRTPLVPFETGGIPEQRETDAIVFLKRPGEDQTDPSRSCYWLSEDGSMGQVGQSLFALIRQLDQKGYSRILCELPSVESSGIAAAVRDRLTRAAAKK